MEPIVVVAASVAPELARALDMGGWSWKAVPDLDAARADEPANGWSGAIVAADDDLDSALRTCHAIRTGDVNAGGTMLLLNGAQLGDLDFRDHAFDDFCLTPFHPVEFEARLRQLFRRIGSDETIEIIEYGPLAMNLETYQAMLDSRPLDLTYMEYELLRFLAAHPGKVFSRETLLSRVWGYDYYGGARTVDVHVRRLRSKMGEEHANLIQTIRSVGYSFGASRWG